MEASHGFALREDDHWIALVRHGAPSVDPLAAPHTWSLSGLGAQAVSELADRLKRLPASQVLCSPEAKARSTAQLLCPGTALQIEEDLREQGLGQVPYLAPRSFEQALGEFFDRPQAAVLGLESAAAAALRMQRVLTRLSGTGAIVVSHGRIISAYVSALLGVHGLAIWQSLKMPDVLFVDPATRRVTRLSGLPLLETAS